VRTFPKSLATFRAIVNERGQKLRQLPYEELRNLAKPPSDGEIERLFVDSRPSTIGVIVETRPDGALRVVVQGFMNARLLPLIRHVALDGFYKHPDESITPMMGADFHEFG
jgi:hypothetical protein